MMRRNPGNQERNLEANKWDYEIIRSSKTGDKETCQTQIFQWLQTTENQLTKSPPATIIEGNFERDLIDKARDACEKRNREGFVASKIKLQARSVNLTKVGVQKNSMDTSFRRYDDGSRVA